MLVLIGLFLIIFGMYKFIVNIQYNPGVAFIWLFAAMIGNGLLQCV